MSPFIHITISILIFFLSTSRLACTTNTEQNYNEQNKNSRMKISTKCFMKFKQHKDDDYQPV